MVEPTDFGDAKEIGDRFKAGQPVIVTLQGRPDDLRRRLVDFCSGVVYVLDGSMKQVTRGAPAVRAHAFAEFSVAYGANPAAARTGEILNSGLLTDEFIHTGTFDTREEIDRLLTEVGEAHTGGDILRRVQEVEPLPAEDAEVFLAVIAESREGETWDQP